MFNKTLLKLLKYLKGEYWLIAFVLIFSILENILASIVNFVIAYILTFFGQNSPTLDIKSDDFSLIQKINIWIQDVSSGNDTFHVLINLSLLMLILVIFKNLLAISKRIVNARIEINLLIKLQRALYEKILKLPMFYFIKEKSGHILSVLINDIGSINNTLRIVAVTLINEPVTIITYLFFMFALNWKITLFSLAAVPIIAIVVDKIAKSLRRKATRTISQLDNLITELNDTIQGIKAIKSFGSEETQMKNYDQSAGQYYRLSFIQRIFAMLNMPIMDIIAYAVMGSIIVLCGFYIFVEQSLSQNDVLALILFFIQIMQPIRNLANIHNDIQLGIISGERVLKVLEEKEESQHFSVQHINAFNEKIEFKNLSFAYEDESSFALKNINFEVNKHETVAIVGVSGSGKSTLFSLLSGFNKCDSGQILIDGISIYDCDLISYRKLLSIVSQDTYLFNKDISFNISMGDDAVNQEKIIEAARFANIHDFIESLDGNYETIAGDKGAKLSGGQRQRISIARAFLKNAPILLLDEATSALDSESERKIQHAIENLIQNKTVLIIAHRLSTIINADRIIVMHNGEIVEIGTHMELLSKNSHYKKLYDLQFSESK